MSSGNGGTGRRQIWIGLQLGDTALGSVSLRQREWNGADRQKQKKVKRASDKMRFDGGVNLFFHFGVVLVRIDFPRWKTRVWERDNLFSQKREKLSIHFS
jgi:hypothetical protein